MVTSGAALETERTNPRAAIKLNQLPSSEMTWPDHNRRKKRLQRSSCVYVRAPPHARTKTTPRARLCELPGPSLNKERQKTV